MTTPSKNDGASEQTKMLSSSPSFVRRFFVWGTSLFLVAVLLFSAILMVPARWSPWLQEELTKHSGLDISWDRFAWRGITGFQITHFRVQAPDESLLVTLPKIKLSWSLGISQHPSLKIEAFELRDIEVYYRENSTTEPTVPAATPKSELLSASQYEAMLQAKLIEIQSLAKVLDSLPFTLVLDQSNIHLRSIEFEASHSGVNLQCSDMIISADMLLSPKTTRRRASLNIGLPKRCSHGADTFNSDGRLALKADHTSVDVDFSNQGQVSYASSTIPIDWSLKTSLTTDLKHFELNLGHLRMDPFFEATGGIGAHLEAPAKLTFEPFKLILSEEGLPDAIRRLILDAGVRLRSGELTAEMALAPVELGDLLRSPLQTLGATLHVEAKNLNLSHTSIALADLGMTYKGTLDGGRLTGTHSIFIGSLFEQSENVQVRKVSFTGEDELLFTALHGESTETLLPGVYRLNIGSVIHPEATIERLSASIRPQVGIKGLEPKWLIAKPILQFARLSTAKLEASHLSTEVDLRLALPSQDARLKASWLLKELKLLAPAEGVEAGRLTQLVGDVSLKWRSGAKRLELTHLKQAMDQWGQVELKDVIVELGNPGKLRSSGSVEAWWKEVPGLALDILAQQKLTLQSEGVTRWTWDGQIPSVPELVEDVCHVETLRTLVRPAEPRFVIGGEVLLHRLALENPESVLRDGQGRLAVDYSLNDHVRLNLRGQSGEIRHQETVLKSFMVEGAASLTPEALSTEHSLTLDALSQPDVEPIAGHVSSGTMEYRFETSQINGEVSFNNQVPALNALARFQGESFGNWLCNGGILQGDLLGLPLLTSSLEVKVGERGRRLVWQEKELEGQVTLDANVVLQEKQIDLDGQIKFNNNDLRDPNFDARGIMGTLPITQRVLYRTTDDNCVVLPMLPKQICVAVGSEEAVKVSLQRDPTLRIAALTSQELTVSRMSAEASYRSGWFGLRDYAAEFLDGDLRGDIYFGLNPDLGFDSRFSLKVSDLQLSRLLPKRFRRGKKTRANFVFDAGLKLKPGVSDLGVELAVTRLEPDALDALLHALEQKTGLAQVSEARSNLAWIDFRGMNVWVRHEGLNIELDYDPIVIGYRPIPRSLMKRYSLRDWVFEPIIEAQMVPILADFLGWEARDVL